MRLMEFANDHGTAILINLDQIVSIGEGVLDSDYTPIQLVNGNLVLVKNQYVDIKAKCRQYITHD